ncbi:putative ABC transport system permease protein [Fluviicoccus keumensis]|uniref:Putative ABC transport system permease protein n=1 Tax=Fluviicoccus keumensis TaxID=1435465 RepID=A0A4Q7ZB41_9GAMM|nr:FtsX-like permease family protein [Fluviicoccus keumensis]RZU47817.1 putative ABC transport system permease protein [Fluviicoccus keumensis]
MRALAWRLLRRDWRAGELTLLLAALALAVAATTSLRFFSTSLEQAMRQQAAQLLGADLVLSSTRGLRPMWVDEAQRLQLRQAQTLEFGSMAQHGEQFQLVTVKAVSPGYPLRGELKLRNGLTGIPAAGTVWVEERLLGLLQAQDGDTLQIGESTLRITAILDRDADRSNGFAALSPRLIMNLADVPATGILQPGSRVNYRLLLAGPPSALQTYQAWGKPRLEPHERLRDVSSGNKRVSDPINNAGSYLSLAAIAAVLLSGIAVALATRRYADRHLDALALMRCLGGTRRQLLTLFGWQLLFLWLTAMLAGGLAGFLAAQGLHRLLAGLLPVTTLEFAIARPLLTGVATATLTLAGFALPAFLKLAQVPPLRVMRRELQPADWSTLRLTALALAALFLLMTLETGKLWLTSLVLLGGLGLAALCGGLLWLALRRWRQRGGGQSRLAQALDGLARQPAATISQVLALGLGLTAMLLVFSLRSELLAQWRADLPADTPNQFAIAIPADQVQPLQAVIQQHHWRSSPFYPVVRGRLVAINGKAVQKPAEAEPDSGNRDNALDRELNLTWSDILPEENTLTEGAWFKPDAAEVSVEAELAKRLDLKLGDSLRLQMAEGSVEARITSLRTVDWNNFRPNFYLVFPRQLLESYPASYLASFHVPDADKTAMSTLVRGFPTVVFADIGQIMAELQKLMDQLADAVQAVLVFVVLAGVLVLLTGIAAGLDGRRQEAALLRALGAKRGQLQRRAGMELLVLGGMAGLLAVLLNEILLAVLTVQLLEGTPTMHPLWWLAVPGTSAMLTLAVGLAGMRRVWTVSPMDVLREN